LWEGVRHMATVFRGVRVLVVEDFEPFLRLIRSILRDKPELQIIGEVSDGMDGVRGAEELQPDLILLDIGLPGLNGIEAARRIRKLAPEARIIFVTQESYADVVKAALSIGASGYVVKARITSDLLLAVEAVCQGRQFVSAGLSGHNCSEETDAPVIRFPVLTGSTSVTTDKKDLSRNHQVHFYSDDAAFLNGFTRFIGGSLNAGVPVIVVATEAHRNSLYQRLQAQGLNVSAAIAQGRYIPLDVADTLATFMVDDMPDPVRFYKVARDLVAAAAKASDGEHPRVAACGECAPFLWAHGKADAAILLEHLWDEVARTYDLDILCGYSAKGFLREQDSQMYERVCAVHSAVCAH
jgi:DNA-binding NarL/FixJ family response regulator